MIPLSLAIPLASAAFAVVVTGVAYVKIAAANSRASDAQAQLEGVKAAIATEREAFAIALRDKEAKAAAAAMAHQQELARQDEANAKRLESIRREITRHVPPAADARCRLNVGFVRVHDAAADPSLAGTSLSSPSGGSEEADSGIALSRAADTIATNYGECHRAISEVRVWRAWYVDQSAIFNQPKGIP